MNGYEYLFDLFPGAVQSWKLTWPILGFIYFAAGIAHFKIEDEFCNIYPSQGAWGFWYLPGSKEFHVEWTGVAEVIGGLGLVIGGLNDVLRFASDVNITAFASLWLLVLTILVTPANIFMLTHGAKLPMNGPTIPILGHVIRLILQSFLFAQFYILSEPLLKTLI